MHKLLSMGLLSLLLPSAALAQTAVVSTTPSGPHAGARELRLNQGILPITGITRYQAGGGDGVTFVGVNPGLGYFVSDGIEVGANLNILILFADSGSAGMFSPGVAPFVRFLTHPDRVRYYGELSLMYQPFLGAGGVQLFGGGADAGLEVAIRDSWSFRIGPTYRYLRAAGTSSNGDLQVSDSGVSAFGLNWGIAAYF
jgi:hypothetical protein